MNHHGKGAGREPWYHPDSSLAMEGQVRLLSVSSCPRRATEARASPVAESVSPAVKLTLYL